MSRPPVRPLLIAALSVTLAGAGLPATFALAASPVQAQQKGTLSGAAFVEQAAVSGMFEIEAAKLALTRSQSQAVRTFAEQMIRDHEAIATALKAAVQEARGDFAMPATLDAKHQQMLDQLKAAGSGASFDAAYAGSQVKAHEAAVGIFTAYASDGDQTALRAFAERQVPVLQRHLDHARALKA